MAFKRVEPQHPGDILILDVPMEEYYTLLAEIHRGLVEAENKARTAAPPEPVVKKPKNKSPWHKSMEKAGTGHE